MARKKTFKAPEPVAYSNKPVLTTAQLAKYYGCSVDSIKVNFNRNKSRFEEGKHFFKLEGETLKIFKDRVTDGYLVGKNANLIYLWTERGAARHAKILDTDKAWEVFDLLEEFYFDNEKFHWNKAREDGKIVRKNFTDVMKKFYEYAKAQGTSRPEVAFYMKYSRLVNKLAGLPDKGGRDDATIQQIGFCSFIEDRMSEIFCGGMEKNLPYKEIESHVENLTKNLFALIKMPIAIAAPIV